MSQKENYDGATAGKVLVFDESETVSFPKKFKEAMGTGKGLMVLVHKDRLIKIFPLESDKVSYLSLEIGKLTNDFLTKLSQIFKKSGLVDLLFSTGVCLRGTRCFYECYFDPEQLGVTEDELNSSLSELAGVKKVIMESVKK
ncbi:hypothetical protein EU537_03325 [Candidatus Thorarchaeota archaeon]|jgi:hypothetical protein|nr:MAG: hypothetical protein EU537_03325 [Candidatus Thorarchaeota archaeon]